MKKVFSLVVSLIFVCSVFFAGCDERHSGSNPTELPSDENSSYTAVQTPTVVVEEPVTSFIEEEENSAEKTIHTDVIFIPTPQEVVEKMLEMAKVTKGDLVYDLGCGDGRIVVTAALKYGCKAVGYDIDPQRVKESLENVKKNSVGHLVTIEQKDIFTLDLSDANVITLYLLPSLNIKLIPQLEKLKPGSRIVSHDFGMRGVKPDEVVTMTGEDGSQHEVHLWTTPLKKESE
jgi:SAM-dependent methyltransferase